MPALTRLLPVWCAATLLAGCTQTLAGRAVPSPTDVARSASPVDVETVMLDQSQMRAVTGAGQDLTIIPSMDVNSPVDIDQLAATVPVDCRWVFAETQTFGREVAGFHKTTFQDPPKGGLISEGAAAYHDGDTARRAFGDLVRRVGACAATPVGPMLVGDWTASPDSLLTGQSSTCGRDYRRKSVVIVEVTFCAFPPSVPDTVIVNMLAKVPG
jgi:hypothetical protein